MLLAKSKSDGIEALTSKALRDLVNRHVEKNERKNQKSKNLIVFQT